jgi:hypothetical protein
MGEERKRRRREMPVICEGSSSEFLMGRSEGKESDGQGRRSTRSFEGRDKTRDVRGGAILPRSR